MWMLLIALVVTVDSGAYVAGREKALLTIAGRRTAPAILMQRADYIGQSDASYTGRAAAPVSPAPGFAGVYQLRVRELPPLSLAVGVPRVATPSVPSYWRLAAEFGIAQAMDTGITEIGLAHGLREGNPLGRHRSVRLAMTAGFALAEAGLVREAYEMDRRGGRAFRAALWALKAYAVYHNTRLVLEAR